MTPEEIKKIVDALLPQLKDQLGEAVNKSLSEDMINDAITKKLEEMDLSADTETIKNMQETIKTLAEQSQMKTIDSTNKSELRKSFLVGLKQSLVENEGKFFSFDAIKKTLTEGATGATLDPSGANLVMEEFYKELQQALGDYGVARGNAKIFPMASDIMKIPKRVSGATAYWTDEASAYTKSNPSFGKVELIAKKVTVLTEVTEEMLQDSAVSEPLWNIIKDSIVEAILAFEDDQVFNGDGVGNNLLGLLVDPNATVALTTGTSLSTVTYDDLRKITMAVEKKYRKKLRQLKWYLPKEAIIAFGSIKDNDGMPILQDKLNDPVYRTLLGYEVVEVEAIDGSAIGASTAYGVFGDMKSYYAMGVREQQSFELGYTTGGFESDIKSMKARERIDGKTIFSEAFVQITTSAA